MTDVTAFVSSAIAMNAFYIYTVMIYIYTDIYYTYRTDVHTVSDINACSAVVHDQLHTCCSHFNTSDYRPVSNLPFLSKLLERVVQSCLLTQLNGSLLTYLLSNKCSAVAEMGDRLATVDMYGKRGLLGPFGWGAAVSRVPI